MGVIPNAPLFRDPIYDGAADPTVIWNEQEKAWWIFYTGRRAYGPNIGAAYVHGTDIGIASSNDGGKNWLFRGAARGLEFEAGRNTFWAPEVICHDGIYHMYVSYIRGIPITWYYERHILHYTSKDLWNWNYEERLKLSSDRVIDACVFEIAPGKWKMWYKDEDNHSFSYAAISDDLFHWEVTGPEITDCAHEGPNVFYFAESYWMVTDPWCGLGVYKSADVVWWERKSNILQEPGIREDDGTIGNHADVLVYKDHCYIFYFTHPEISEEDRNNKEFVWKYKHRRTSLQVAEITIENGKLACDRNNIVLELK